MFNTFLSSIVSTCCSSSFAYGTIIQHLLAVSRTIARAEKSSFRIDDFRSRSRLLQATSFFPRLCLFLYLLLTHVYGVYTCTHAGRGRSWHGPCVNSTAPPFPFQPPHSLTLARRRVETPSFQALRKPAQTVLSCRLLERASFASIPSPSFLFLLCLQALLASSFYIITTHATVPPTLHTQPLQPKQQTPCDALHTTIRTRRRRGVSR